MKKRELKKCLSLLLGTAIVASSLVGCGGSGSNETAATAESKEETVVAETESAVETATEDVAAEDDGELFPAYDLGGVTLRLGDFDGANPNIPDLQDYQIEERQANVDRIQEKYNVKLEFVKPSTDVWEDIPKEYISAYASGKPIADVMSVLYQFLGTYVVNDMFIDMTDTLNNTDIFNEKSHLTWLGKKWGVRDSGLGGEGLFYNADMIANLGMEKTPAEMFDEGKWSYDDFYDYCLEMKSKMAEDEYPFYIDPYYWILFATAGNGGQILDDNGNLSYLDPGMLETLEFLQKLIDDGLCRKANMTEDGAYDTWGTSMATFDNGVEVAMAHRAAWQAPGLVGKFNIGFVPYPWGSNVTVENAGEPGAYKTLSDNYRATYYDGAVACLVKGIEEKADPLAVSVMIADLYGWDYASSKYVPEEGSATRGSDFLSTQLDVDLYNFSISRERWEPYNSLDLDLTLSLNDIYYGGESLRSSMESFYNADIAAMKEAGYVAE